LVRAMYPFTRTATDGEVEVGAAGVELPGSGSTVPGLTGTDPALIAEPSGITGTRTAWGTSGVETTAPAPTPTT
jgi:hypothetical protein